MSKEIKSLLTQVMELLDGSAVPASMHYPRLLSDLEGEECWHMDGLYNVVDTKFEKGNAMVRIDNDAGGVYWVPVEQITQSVSVMMEAVILDSKGTEDDHY